MPRSYLPALLAVFLLAASAFTHDGDHPPDLRVWKDAEGLFEIEAAFVLARDGKVQLWKHDGSRVWVPLERLSRHDRAWVRQRLNGIASFNEPKAAPGEGLAPTKGRPEAALWVPGTVVGVMVFLAALGLAWKRSRAVALPALVCVLSAFTLTVSADEAAPEKKDAPRPRQHFEPFKDKLELRHDENYLYVGSNAFPDHPMMVGITAWQQQVPLPQPYTGKNAWRIPLNPVLAKKPISAKTALYRGAIALAVNGVPIFNALNNRGEDAYLAGELDEFGGHCGRGDDYHYHIAPVHLEKAAGKGKPIAYALDGFPIYGYADADGKEPKDLDEYNGRTEKDGYRYYSTKKYPYINGGMRGVVTVRGDQIDPQPRDAPVRPAQRPLGGAKITGFTRDDVKKTYKVEYDVRGKAHSVQYTIDKDGTFPFVYTDGDGTVTKRTYRRDRRPPRPGTTWLGGGLLGAGLLSLLGAGLLFATGRDATKPKRYGALALLVAGSLAVAGGGALLGLDWIAAPPDQEDEATALLDRGGIFLVTSPAFFPTTSALTLPWCGPLKGAARSPRQRHICPA